MSQYQNSSKLSQILAVFKKESDQKLDNSSDDFSIINGNGKRYEIDIAMDLKTRKKAYQLMYDLYRNPDINYAEENASKMWYSLFNAQANTTTLIAKDTSTKKIVATLTIVFDSELGLPMEENYSLQLNELRIKNRKCAEIISLGFEKEATGSPDLLIGLFKYAYVISNSIYSATDFLIMVKPKHSLFYEKKLFFSQLGEQINCKKINDKPVVLYHLDLLLAKQETEESLQNHFEVKKRNKGKIFSAFLQAQKQEKFVKILEYKIAKSEMSIRDLKYFFMLEQDIFSKADSEKLLWIAEQYRNGQTKTFLSDVCLNFA